MTSTLAERFFLRFEGLPRAHGASVASPHVVPGKKVEAKYETIHAPPTIAHWQSHLAGESAVGIVPIRDDATCRFGAIDVDRYNLDLERVAEDIAKSGLPLIACRTKSGGAHLYLFTSEFVPADLMRTRLMEWAAILGYNGCEIFPKQSKLAGPNDHGSWMNMPYFAGNETNRWAIANGRRLTPEKFLDLADMIAISTSALQEFNPEPMNEFQEWLEEGPPCLQSLAKQGFGEGQRNNALFNIGVYLRKRFEDDWEHKVDEYNQKFMNPPLGHKEVAHIVKSLGRKSYGYKCNDAPIVNCCNRQLCLGRKYGIGGGRDDPGVTFGPLIKVKTEPPIWIWDVDGARLELTTQELKDQARFQSRCIDVLNKWPFPVKPQKWAEIVREKLAQVEILAVPPDATQEGQMMAHLEWYCTGRATARAKEDLLQFKPWTDSETKRTYFSAVHFRQYLEQHRMRVSEKQLWAWLRKRNGQHHFFKIKNKGINVWSVPAFESQTEDFRVPSTDDF